MSDSKMVAQPQKKIADLEKSNLALLARIQKYDSLIEDNRSLRTQLSILQTSFHEELSFVRDLLAKHGDIHGHIRSKIEEIKSAIDNSHNHVEVSLKGVKTSIDNHDENMVTLSNRIDNVDTKHSNLSREFCLSTDLYDHKESTTKELKVLEEYQKNLGIRISALEERRSHEFLRLLEQEKSMSKLAKSDDELACKTDSLDKSIKCTHEELKASIAKEIEQLENFIQDCLQEMKSELLSSPTAIEPIRDELMRRFESVALDGKNAVLKAGNADSKIYLIEKKIENLFLLLKKHELSQ